MKSQFKISGMMIAAALLAGILMLPAVGNAQATGSNASLQDTLTWLTSFVPTATGARDSDGVTMTSNIRSTGGCNLTETVSFSSSPQTYTFSLSDIDPASVSIGGSGVFWVRMETRSGVLLIKAQDGNKEWQMMAAWVGDFADKPTAQRVANAFQHAAQLCANSQPF